MFNLIFNHTLFVDGVAIGTSAVNVALPSLTTAQIAGWPPQAPQNFEGVIDDVRVYNQALTSDEVRNLYELR